MQICKEHWERCVQAIKDRGLWGLVHQDGKSLAEAQLRSLKGEPPLPTDWDPLAVMNWNFMTKALEHGGLAMMTTPRDGEGFVDESGERHYCPLCEARDRVEGGGGDESWIEGCGDSIRAHAVSLGLVAGRQ